MRTVTAQPICHLLPGSCVRTKSELRARLVQTSLTPPNSPEYLWENSTPASLLKFYASQPSLDDLVRFVKTRPKPKLALLKERWSADMSVIVVIPTENSSSNLASNARRVFDPLPVLFVEASGPLFNYSYSVNSGTDEALKESPDWIIISNDDMFLVDSISKLSRQLRAMDKVETSVVFASPDTAGTPHHTHPCVISPAPFDLFPPIQFGRDLTYSYFRTAYFRKALLRKYRVQMVPLLLGVRRDKLRPVAEFYKSIGFLSSRLRRTETFYACGDFIAVKASVLRKMSFDEGFINGYEDVDFSYRATMSQEWAVSDFRIGSVGSASLGKQTSRGQVGPLRSVMNLAYFYWKHFKQPVTPR